MGGKGGGGVKVQTLVHVLDVQVLNKLPSEGALFIRGEGGGVR